MTLRRLGAGLASALSLASVLRCSPAPQSRIVGQTSEPPASARDAAPEAASSVAPDTTPVVVASTDASDAAPAVDAATPTAAAAASSPAPVACHEPVKTRLLPPAPAAWTRCGKDSHCVIVAEGCCACGMLFAGQARAVNVPATQQGNPYCKPGTGCPACASFPNPSLAAVCVGGRCRARETIDPCASPPGLLEQMSNGP